MDNMNRAADDLALVAALLNQYDALANWTMIESRYVSEHTGWTDAKAYRLANVVRRNARRNRVR
jgi:hypothetical protein